MNTKKWMVGGKWLALLGMAFSLFACVEINGSADVGATGHVKVVTTYDFSKVFNNIKSQNPALSDRMEGFDCKIFVSNSANFKCEDQGLLKYKMSDELDKPAGVGFDEAKQELSFDAVKFFAEVTDLKNMVQRNSGQVSLLTEGAPALLPLQSARRERYIKEGMSIVLKVKFANDIVSVDGQPVQNAGREMTINFLDIADKPAYVIVTKNKGTKSGTWLFVGLVLCLLALAVWFLWRQKNSGTTPPSGSTKTTEPTGPTGPTEPTVPSAAAAPAQDESSVDTQASTATNTEAADAREAASEAAHKPTRGERFAQAISAAAVGVGSSAVGGGANHTVEEVLAQEVGSVADVSHSPAKTDEDGAVADVSKPPVQPNR